MQVGVTYSTSSSSIKAIEEIFGQIDSTKVTALYCYFTEEYDVNIILAELKKSLPEIPIHGCSTCEGILTHDGFIEGPVIGCLWLTSKSTLISTGLARCDINDPGNIEQQVDIAITKALHKSERLGEIPDLLLLHATTGIEEQVIEAINKKFKTPIPLLGGTAADNNLEGKWSILTEDGVVSNGVSVSLIFSNKPVLTSFGTGYTPTECTGIVTKASHRKLLEIDGRAANSVYQEWVAEYLDLKDNESLLRSTGSFPLGRYVGNLFDQPYFKLSHPVEIDHQTNGISLFTNIAEGDVVSLMQGNKNHLITRIGRIISSASESSVNPVRIEGALSVFCAGSMYSIKEQMNEIRDELSSVLDKTPFICPFTYGEQGQILSKFNAHGNLMISSVIFSNEP
jgi:hypothetical protein